MTECLTCEDVKERICLLLDELSSLESCQGVKVSDSGITYDYTEVIKAKYRALDALVKLEERKCPKGAGELWEFLAVPCVRPATCVGTVCSTSRQRGLNRRRYRR